MTETLMAWAVRFIPVYGVVLRLLYDVAVNG